MQRQHFDHETTSYQQSEPAYAPQPEQTGHIQGVRVTSGGLLHATLGSAMAAAIILVFFWLPAEYGVDPTGVGRTLGLTQMGEIKQQLYAEAANEDAVLAARAAANKVSSDPALLGRLDTIEAELASIKAAIGAKPLPPSTSAPAAVPVPAPVDEPKPTARAEPAAPQAPEWRDEVSYTLAPTQGIEFKLVMNKGSVAEFEWTANGAVLNYDTHGAGGGQRVSYEKGRGVPEQAGKLVAAFKGKHGWFWRNRTNAPVTFTLRTRGDYAQIVAP